MILEGFFVNFFMHNMFTSQKFIFGFHVSEITKIIMFK